VARPRSTNGQACQRRQQRGYRLPPGGFLNTYFDTGVLLKVYVQELNSAEAIALVSKIAPPIPFTHFHTIELFTAIRLKRFRAEINANEEKTAIQVLRADITNERLQLPDYDLLQLFRRAEVLSAKYAAIFGTRTLDILHVAAALEAECTEFVSFDERQRKVAAKERLTVVPHQLQKQSKP
jgi:predicted nucleic acid-binding protein